MHAVSLKCPRCGQSDLVVTERQEIEIDVCPSCRGVWLDRGELDKLIERSLSLRPARDAGPALDDDDDDDHRSWRQRDRDDDDHRPHERRKRPHSWLSDLFD